MTSAGAITLWTIMSITFAPTSPFGAVESYLPYPTQAAFAMELAILDGETASLDFGDLNWKGGD
jgi:hypothetical protein